MISSEQPDFDKSVLNDLYTEYPMLGVWWESGGRKIKHPASSTSDPLSPLFIAIRNRRTNMYRLATEQQSYDFLNPEAQKQYAQWVQNMWNAQWYDEQDFGSFPVSQKATFLAEYCLAFWSHYMQDDTLALSMHASDKIGGKDHQSQSGGFVLVNGEAYSMINSYSPEEELRDTVPLLQGAFGIPQESIAVNLNKPFPRRNVWDIPGGKMMVVPENYDSPDAGVLSIRLVSVDRRLKLL